jgi:outer membrane protein OmpA-like peptidoglycan-associated protein
VPASPIQTLGNRLLGLLFGDKMSAMMAGVAAATGVSAKASSGLTTLAAPMVLAALRNKLGGAPTAASLAGLLSADKGAIAGAMPPSLRAMYGLTSLAPAGAAPAAAAPSVAATVAPVVAAAAPIAAAAVAAAHKPAAPAAHSSSGYASTTVTSATPTAHTPKPVSPVAAPAPAAARVAPVAASVATAAPAAASAAHGHGHSHAAKPAAPAATAAYHASHEVEDSGAHMGTKVALLGGLALLTALIWYLAYGRTPPPVVPAAKPVAAVVAPAPAPAPVAKPAPAPVAVAPAPAPAPAPVAAPASTQLVPVPGANGLVKYTLPGGASIEVAKDGLESKMLTFINTKDAAIDNKLWFDFDRLSFVTASSDLTPESKAQVSSAVAILKAYPAVSVKIGGYTDNQGNPDANLKLSDQRANRVMEEMVAGGVAPDRIEAKGYGDQHPVADNETAEGRAKNRRTSLSIRTK